VPSAIANRLNILERGEASYVQILGIPSHRLTFIKHHRQEDHGKWQGNWPVAQIAKRCERRQKGLDGPPTPTASGNRSTCRGTSVVVGPSVVRIRCKRIVRLRACRRGEGHAGPTARRVAAARPVRQLREQCHGSGKLARQRQPIHGKRPGVWPRRKLVVGARLDLPWCELRSEPHAAGGLVLLASAFMVDPVAPIRRLGASFDLPPSPFHRLAT